MEVWHQEQQLAVTVACFNEPSIAQTRGAKDLGSSGALAPLHEALRGLARFIHMKTGVEGLASSCILFQCMYRACADLGPFSILPLSGLGVRATTAFDLPRQYHTRTPGSDTKI